MTDTDSSAYEQYALRTVASEARSNDAGDIPFELIWRELLNGQARIVDQFFCRERAFLVFLHQEGPQPSPSMRRNLTLLSRVLGGTDQKVVALDEGLAVSTVTSALRRGIQFVGLDCRPSRVPFLLVMLARAARQSLAIAQGRAVSLVFEGNSYYVLSAPVPDWGFPGVLSPAVRAVVRLRVEGRSHAEIAQRRHTSRRTVANQLAAAFQRLGVSGRSDLMSLLVRS